MKDLSEVHATTTEAAAWFGVKVSTVRTWVFRGKVKPSGTRRGQNTYRLSELAAVDRDVRETKVGRPRTSRTATCA